MNGEGNLCVPGASGTGKCLLHEGSAVASALILGLQRNAQLGGVRINGREPGAWRQHAHPAGPGIDAVDNRDHADIRFSAPPFHVNARARGPQNFDGTRRRGRRIPKREVQPMPEAGLIVCSKHAEA